MHQHDIDILDNRRISVYDNKRTTRAVGNIVMGANELLVFDLQTNELTSPWKEVMRSNNIRTMNQGLADFDAEVKDWLTQAFERA